jgi:hypothetical protein
LAVKVDKKVTGRPPIEIDWGKLDAILQFGARALDCRGILDVSEDCIADNIKKKYGLTFSEYRELRMSTMRAKLLQKQFDVAMMGNVAMLIWLGKQHLDQKDKQEIDQKTAQIQINIDATDAKA